MTITRRLLGALVAAMAMAAPAALACEGADVLHSDDFSSADPAAWGDYDGTTIGGGTLSIEINPAAGYVLLNEARSYGDFDVCVDLVQHNQDPDGGWGSLVFWALDYANYYTLDLTTSGYFKVSRLHNDRWLSPVDWTKGDNVNPGTGTNALRIVTRGRVATVFVNGEEVARFRGQPPEGGSRVGIYGAAPSGSGATIDFSNFIVTSAD